MTVDIVGCRAIIIAVPPLLAESGSAVDSLLFQERPEIESSFNELVSVLNLRLYEKSQAQTTPSSHKSQKRN